jgi:hypothetical protein
MKTHTIEHLQQQIESLVRAHLAAQRAAATTAVERAFAAAATSPRTRTTPPRKTWGRRRPPTEVADIAERLFAAVRAHPGETMAVIAPAVGETPRALNRPMVHLKRAGRVRSAGQRHLTRYFPMTSSKSS